MIKAILKSILPSDLRQQLRQLQKKIVYFSRRQLIRIPVARGIPMKIIVGAAMTHQRGWYSTNEQWLDITQSQDWEKIFRGKPSLTHVLAEHVFEHLTEKETKRALELVSKHMTHGGRIRIAVPDGYHPDPVYRRHVGIAGIGADAEDHKQLLNCDVLTSLLEETGFSSEMSEGYLNNGELVQKPIDSISGTIIRSRSNPETMAKRAGWEFADANTSLVVDGIKKT